jgi:hypothetical protein
VYRAYLEEEIEADEKMGKKWFDITGRTKSVDNRSR